MRRVARVPLSAVLRHCLSSPGTFSRLVVRRPLRPYQLEPARRIIRAVVREEGGTFAVMMARQAGKNELSAQIEAYLLNLYQRRGGQIVKASPTFKPQTINSILRLCERLENPWNAGASRRRAGYMVELGRARSLFFSAAPSSRVVGATADLLLEADEAQDISEEKWYRDFTPMAASTNATTVLYGTAWTSDSLLARTLAHLRETAPAHAFRYDAEQVAAHVPRYGDYVQQQVARLGRQHPLVKTQYYLEPIDAAGRLFPPQRQALMHGDHPRQREPTPGRRYALTLDVGGAEETPASTGFSRGSSGSRTAATGPGVLANPRRDATGLTVLDVEIRPGGLPRYRAVDRRHWIGVRHTALHSQITHLVHHWHAAWVVVDATGIGAGLASFLARALEASQVLTIPVVFSAKTKSELGWSFVAAIETGRYRDYAVDGEPDTRQFWYEVGACEYQAAPGPGERIRWGVWEQAAYDGITAHGHDDLLVSASLCTLLDHHDPQTTGPAEIARRPDPLAEIDTGDW